MSSQPDEAPEPTRAGANGHTHHTAPTRFVESGGTRFAYRRFGNPIGTPIVLLQHFMGNLDTYDSAIIDALAAGREGILTDNAGVGLSTGAEPETVIGMARDAASFVDALGLDQVDLFGFSMRIRCPAGHRRSAPTRKATDPRRRRPARRPRHGPTRTGNRTAVYEGL
jgi:hypothetical protein